MAMLATRTLLLFTLAITLALSTQIRHPSHKHWTPLQDRLKSIPPITGPWNDCDKRCVAFESQRPDVDFFVLYFQASKFNPRISACYGKSTAGQSQFWHYFVQDQKYWDECGEGDWNTDLRKSGSHNIVGLDGVGMGTQIK